MESLCISECKVVFKFLLQLRVKELYIYLIKLYIFIFLNLNMKIGYVIKLNVVKFILKLKSFLCH